MNFKSEIDKAYSEMGLIPINGQEKIVDNILTEFFINHKRHVIANLDTGTGKSIIGAIVALVFKYKYDEDNKNNEMCNATITVHSNSLVKQYEQTFDSFESDKFHQIIGASNYKCEAAKHELSNNLNDNRKEFTGEDCYKSKADPEIQRKYCERCDYNRAKSFINKTDTLITNYSYHFISSMWSHHLKPRRIVIFDEAHTINDVFCEHNTIYISVERINHYIDECKEKYPIETREYRRQLIDIRDKMLLEEINESCYVETIKSLSKAYAGISRVFKNAAATAELEEYMKLNKISKKFCDLGCKIGDLITHQYEHIFESKPGEFSIKPIFVGAMSDVIMGEYNLFMSATISDELMKTTLHLSDEETAFIKIDPVYSPENKPVFFCGTKKLNFSEMKNPDTINELKEVVKEIVSSANDDGYKGLLFVPSFALGETIAEAIPKETKKFLHKRGEKIDEVVKAFKAYEGKSILISPSIYEGLDFSDDYSRYQIILKTPFPSLGDKRIEYILKNYPSIYKIMTIMKLVQAVGRSVRNKDDFAYTFVCDKSAEQLFLSPLNVWKNQFNFS